MKKSLNTSALVTADSPKGQIATETFSAHYALAYPDFITPGEVMGACPSIVYTVEQITTLTESLPSEDLVDWCRDNEYAIIPAPPTALSLFDVCEIFNLRRSNQWKFAREDKTSFGWLLVKKRPIDNSTDKNWEEQNQLLSIFEKVPNIAEMGWFITTYFEIRGSRLFEGICVRTSSLDADGRRLSIGSFRTKKDLNISRWLGDYRRRCVGLSAARKSSDS